MSSDCNDARTTISILLGNAEVSDPTEAEVHSAFRHLKCCGACRSTLSPEDQAKFIRNAILERE